jgi:cysteine-rich repeat protein
VALDGIGHVISRHPLLELLGGRMLSHDRSSVVIPAIATPTSHRGGNAKEVLLFVDDPRAVRPSACGNGLVEPNRGEICDDGNLRDLDGCSARCTLDGCGDGVVDIDLQEQCDDGNRRNGDGCDDSVISRDVATARWNRSSARSATTATATTATGAPRIARRSAAATASSKPVTTSSAMTETIAMVTARGPKNPSRRVDPPGRSAPCRR